MNHKMLGQYHLGLVRDNGQLPRRSFESFRSKLPMKSSGKANWKDFLHRPMDQGSGEEGTGSCVGHGVAGAIYTTMGALGMPIDFVPSPRHIYTPARAIERAERFRPTSVLSLPALSDEGCMVAAGIGAVSEWGIQAMVPFSDRYSDVDIQNVNEEIIPSDYEQMATKLVVGAIQLDMSDPSKIEEQFRLGLDAGYMVVTGGFVDSSWMEYGPNSKPLGAPDFTDPKGGGHCTYIWGYDAVPSSNAAVYDGMNSWSEGWGIDGTYQVTSRNVQLLWEAWLLKIKLVRS